MSFPVFMTEIIPDPQDAVTGSGGSLQAVPPDAFYYLVTGKTSSGTGRSFLNLLGALLTTSAGGVTWTAVLTSDLKIKVSHDNGAAQGLTINRGLAIQLGAIYEDPANPTSTYSAQVAPAGFGGVPATTGFTFPCRPQLLWCPEMIISGTGPKPFDPALTSGIPKSGGTAVRAPDSNAAYVDTGELVDAEFFFKGVMPYYRAQPQTVDVTGSLLDLHINEDFITWWEHGPGDGRRLIMWRNKADVVGSAAPSFSTAQKKYTEYQPNDSLRAAPDINTSTPGGMVHWDIWIRLWGTPMGERVY